MKTQMRIMLTWVAFISMSAWNCSKAGNLNLVSAPLYLGTAVDPNVFFEVDDSGSMDWETLTNEFDYYLNYWSDSDRAKITHGMWESFASTGSSFTGQRSYGYMFAEADRLYQATSAYGANAEGNPESLQRDWRARSADFNLAYYNPSVTYTPWVGKANSSFTAARSDPQPGSDGYASQRNLAGFVFEVVTDDHGYVGVRPDGPGDATDTANGIVDLWDSHTKYTVNAATLDVVAYTVPAAATMDALNTDCNLGDAQDTPPYEDCFGTVAASSSLTSTDVNPWGRTLAAEQQNVANWYTYYRKRSYVAKASIAAVVDAADDFRYGMSLINEDDQLFVQVPASGITTYDAHNDAMLEALFDYNWGALGTPLRTGLETVGKYFDANLTGKTDPIISQCQQNFSILLTDGYWSGSDPAAAIGDADGDGRSRTLADVARYYYNKDLSPLANNVPTSVIDGNNKQHMVTFGVAFGVVGDLVDTDGDGYPNPVLDENDTWGANPYSNDQGKVDDLWHAAFNSKGEYVAAQTPAALVTSLTSALSAITDRVGSSASVATNSGSLNAGTHIFQARFDSGGWSGQLIAYAINPDGTLNPVPSWEASDELDMQNYNTGRVIITFNPNVDSPAGGAVEGKGVKFRFPADYTAPNALTDLSTTQINTLLTYAPAGSTTAQKQAYGTAFVNYLRGDRSNEDGGYDFRDRNSALGDIVDSDPQYVGPPRFRYPNSLQAVSYSSFAAAYASRPPMVYVGANDGMLHGFAEADGTEKLAYIPNQVFANLPELGKQDYQHRFYVNEAPTIVDAFLDGYSGGAWRTMLVGGLGLGGQGFYALDVTDPNNFSETNASQIAKWEFNHTDDADLGYSFGSASIAKMHNGKWVAVFGNGYNNTVADGYVSTTGNAVLYIVDLETGDLIKKIDTKKGKSASADGTTPNGLGSPALVDINRDFLVDYIYAGDLQGNLWKFDVTSANPNSWDADYKQGANPLPIFTTATGQPITTRPQVAVHPTGEDGYMVYFGTGKYLEANDNVPAGSTTQAFYGIWDKNETNLTAFDSSDLLQQYITNQYAAAFDTNADNEDDAFYNLRDVSDYPIDYSAHMGWFIELRPQKIEGIGNTNNFGEKQVSNALVRDGKVIFTTLLPSQNACDFGGSSYIMELDFTNGGQLGFPPFDLTGDNSFDSDDTYVGGSQTDVGIVPTLSIISDGDSETAFGSGSSGDVESVGLNVGDNALGRQSWRQLL